MKKLEKLLQITLNSGYDKFIKGCLICFIIVIYCISGCKQNVKKAEQTNTGIQMDNTMNGLKNNDIEKIDTMGIIQRNKELGQYVIVSQELLKDNDLDYLTPRDLRFIRNEIYARYCYKFKDTTLLGYFKRQYKWYVPLLEDVSNFITPIEKQNIELILSREKTNPKLSDEQLFQIYIDSICKNVNHDRPSFKLLMYKFKPLLYGELYDFSIQFPETDRYIYLLHSYIGGWDGCPISYSIHQYSKKGQLLGNFFIGDSDTRVVYTYKDDGWHEIMLVFYKGDRGDDYSDDENYEPEYSPPDTTRSVFSFDKNTEQIVFKKIE